MSENRHIVIVGAGQAGAQVAIGLRQKGFGGAITLIGDEAELPYERPPLSKDYLAGNRPFERLLLRPESFWAERNVVLRLKTKITRVDTQHKQVFAENGDALAYDTLVWATGGRPRRPDIEGHDLDGVHYVRTRADIDRIKASLEAVKSVCIIGGGYIGLEAAAVLCKLGKQVCVLEAQSRVLSRVAGEDLSRFYEAQHRAQGVDVLLDAKIERITGHNDHVTGITLNDGTQIDAQMVIVGIGIIPAVEPLLAAGAKGDNGVEVDAFCRTNLSDIYALGDCALHANVFADGSMLRLESVQNANDQAQTVVKSILGAPEPYEAIPWFWSDQYDLKLQTVGLSCGHDQVVLRGDPATRRFTVIYLKNGRVKALDCVNSAADFIQGRALVTKGASPSPDDLRDPERPLKTLV